MPTILEKVRDNPDETFFRSDIHRVFAAIDKFPRLPYHCVIAPFDGMPDEDVHFNNLDQTAQLKLIVVADAVGKKILGQCTESQRVITHIEGWGIRDHAHIVVGAAERGQGVELYAKKESNAEEIQRTFEAMRFSPVEFQAVEARLADVR